MNGEVPGVVLGSGHLDERASRGRAPGVADRGDGSYLLYSDNVQLAFVLGLDLFRYNPGFLVGSDYGLQIVSVAFLRFYDLLVFKSSVGVFSVFNQPGFSYDLESGRSFCIHDP